MPTNHRIVPPHRIVVLAYDGVVPFDLSTPCEVFERTRLADQSKPYQVLVCAEKRQVRTASFSIQTRHSLRALLRADTVILPGIDDVSVPVSKALTRAVCAAAARGARIVSLCTGAFVLASTGLLDGLSATTHWMAAEALATKFPLVRVDPTVLYVDNGKVLTSAGAAAGLDLCLYLVRCDFGADVAAHTARLSVMPLERAGGQAQFIRLSPAPDDLASLHRLLDWAQRHLDQPLSARTLAAQGGFSLRTLHRHFQNQLQTGPAAWIARARIASAQILLEKSTLSIDLVAERVGFESTNAFRSQFRKVTRTTPKAWRDSFGQRK